MSVQPVVSTEMPLTGWGVEESLSLIASDAAVELDNLLLGKGSDVTSVQRLALLIKEELGSPHGSPITSAPATLVVMSQAIDDSKMATVQPKTVPELIAKAGEIGLMLMSISNDPHHPQNGDSIEQTKRLKFFCLALSRVASAHELSECRLEGLWRAFRGRE